MNLQLVSNSICLINRLGSPLLFSSVTPLYISVIFFALYLFLIDQAWTYLLDGLTWLVNKIVGI